jgi:hypothetical protein
VAAHASWGGCNPNCKPSGCPVTVAPRDTTSNLTRDRGTAEPCSKRTNVTESGSPEASGQVSSETFSHPLPPMHRTQRGNHRLDVTGVPRSHRPRFERADGVALRLLG